VWVKKNRYIKKEKIAFVDQSTSKYNPVPLLPWQRFQKTCFDGKINKTIK
jgi:hypothetical protein